MPNEKRYIPFSNGAQYLDWEASNCGRCKKAATKENFKAGIFTCDIEKDLVYGAIADGTVTKEIAQRMGLFGHELYHVWRCGEFEAKI